METELKSGLEYVFEYIVKDDETVPNLFKQAEELKQMPKVLASAYMIGLVEWACIQLINKHINWPSEQSVGTGFNLSHIAATPVGFKVSIKVVLEKVEGRKLTFNVEVSDQHEVISKGTHERFIINPDKFNIALEKKISAEKHS